MDKKDFRTRLREHTVEPSVPAWEQMEGMLDALPTKEEKKKRGFWWIFFILLIGIAATSYFTLLPSTQSDLDKTLSNETSSAILEVKGENQNVIAQTAITAKIDTAVRNASDTATDLDEYNPNETQLSNANTQSQANRKSTVSTENIYGNTVSKSLGSLKETNFVNKSEKQVENETNQRTAYNNSVSEIKLSASKLAPTKDHRKKIAEETANEYNTLLTNDKTMGRDPEDIMELPPSADIDQNDVYLPLEGNPVQTDLVEVNDEVQDKLLESIEYLRKSFSEIGYTSHVEESAKMTKVHKPSNFWMMAHTGYAEINTSKGFIVGLGAVYEVDKIISLESNLSYSYGTEQGISIGNLKGDEWEVDLNFLVHLNIININNSKFSLDLGGGYSFYRLNDVKRTVGEPDELVIKNNSGRNLQGRLTYMHRINKDTALGVSGGVISFDDAVAYLSFRYLSRF